MIRIVIIATSAFLACVSALCQLRAPTAISDFGYSSCGTRSCLFVPDDQHPKTYHQGSFSYSVNESGKFTLTQGTRVMLSTQLENLSASVYVTWTKESNWFAITWSNGGALGGFKTRVFHVTGNRLDETAPVDRAFSNFKIRHWCETRGDNVQAYGWDKKTGALVLVTSVYPTSDCGKEMGQTEAYMVEPTSGAILSHLSLRAFNKYARVHPQ